MQTVRAYSQRVRGVRGSRGPEKVLLFLSLFFSLFFVAIKNNAMFSIDSNKSSKEQKADCCR